MIPFGLVVRLPPLCVVVCYFAAHFTVIAIYYRCGYVVLPLILPRLRATCVVITHLLVRWF